MSSRTARLCAALGATLLVAGCTDGPPDVSAGRGDIRNAIAKGQLTSPKAATVALVSLEGAPDAVAARFRETLPNEAAAREIVITDEASARYLARGYLSAYPGEGGGVQVAYAYDLFDARDHGRRQRVSDTMDVPGDPADPWAAVTPSVLTSVVGRGTDELALSLGGTPEAQAAAGKVASAPPVAP